MLKSQVIYVQVKRNEFDCWNHSSGQRETVTSENAFSSDRLAISDFVVSIDVLKKAIGFSNLKYFLKPKPTLIMHQRYNGENISPIEIRILQELAVSSGARSVHIWQGDELTENDLSSKVYENT